MTSAVADSGGRGKRHVQAIRPAEPRALYDRGDGRSECFNIFGDPDELRERLGELAEQMQGAQRVAWADNAIKLAVDMTVAAINRLDLTGAATSRRCRSATRSAIVFPEAVTLVREAREGFPERHRLRAARDARVTRRLASPHAPQPRERGAASVEHAGLALLIALLCCAARRVARAGPLDGAASSAPRSRASCAARRGCPGRAGGTR